MLKANVVKESVAKVSAVARKLKVKANVVKASAVLTRIKKPKVKASVAKVSVVATNPYLVQ